MPSVGAATYSGDPSATDLDLVRHLTGDTGFDGTWWLSDAEINYELVRWTDTTLTPPVVRRYTTAAACARDIRARVAQRVDVLDGDARAYLSQQLAGFAALCDQLDCEAARVDGLAPFKGVPFDVGLTAVDDGPYFRVGMHDSPQLPSLKVENDDPPPWAVADGFSAFP